MKPKVKKEENNEGKQKTAEHKEVFVEAKVQGTKEGEDMKDPKIDGPEKKSEEMKSEENKEGKFKVKKKTTGKDDEAIVEDEDKDKK